MTKIKVKGKLYENDKRVVTSASVVSVASGVSPGVSVEETSEGNLGFSFILPKGDVGPQGPAGKIASIVTNGSGNAVTAISGDSDQLTVEKSSTFSLNNHTHKYAGSSSVGGAANSADKLGTVTVGSTIKPIYLDEGSPVACTHTVEKSVPANAMFTDTKQIAVQSTQPTDTNIQLWIKI